MLLRRFNSININKLFAWVKVQLEPIKSNVPNTKRFCSLDRKIEWSTVSSAVAYERRPISGCRVRAEPVTAGNTSAFAGYMQAQPLNQAIVKYPICYCQQSHFELSQAQSLYCDEIYMPTEIMKLIPKNLLSTWYNRLWAFGDWKLVVEKRERSKC